MQVPSEVVIGQVYSLVFEKAVFKLKLFNHVFLEFVVDDFFPIDAVNHTHARPKDFRKVHKSIITLKVEYFDLLLD